MRPPKPESIAQGKFIREYEGHDWTALKQSIQSWATELGFSALGVADVDLQEAETRFLEWLELGFHGTMDYMRKHGTRRSRPAELIPGTVRIISVRFDYWPDEARDPWDVLQDGNSAYVSRYAIGRDYHKSVRQRLQHLATRIEREVGPFGYRAFTDSAPVLEKPLAVAAGLGWMGKHTNILSRDAGSWFFLGELYTDLPIPVDAPIRNHCGQCTACMDECPTDAIVGPYQLDARRCISYLTIELKGSIPEEFRPLIGNRIFGCDDCQLVCPWNRFSRPSKIEEHVPRNGLDYAPLVDLFAWTAIEFDERTRGSAIRRVGYERFLRNIAVALGNAPTSEATIEALRSRENDTNSLVREHVAWALDQHLSQPGQSNK